MRVMQIDLEDCDVKQHRTKLTIEFTSNVGSLVSWAPRGLNPNWKVPRVPLNIQGSALLFLFQATFPKRYLKLRGDWVLRHPTPATEENFSERRTCLSLLPHTGTLKYHHLTSHTALQHAVTSFAQQSLCVHFLWQFQETQRWKDQIPALHEVFLQLLCPGSRVSLVQDLKKVNDKCACSISKDTVLQPSSLYSPPQQWALRGFRMGEN